jgi:hypothetical protein
MRVASKCPSNRVMRDGWVESPAMELPFNALIVLAKLNH